MKEVSKMNNFLSLDNIDTTNVEKTKYIHKYPTNFRPVSYTHLTLPTILLV